MRKITQLGYMFLVMVVLVNVVFPVEIHAAAIKEQFHVTKHVHYKDTEYTQSKTKQRVRVLQINTGDPNTFVDLGLAPSLGALQRTTDMANRYQKEGYYVLGAINGSFFYNYGPNYQRGMPMNLIAVYNRLIQAGEVFDSKKNYVNEPIAFGRNAQGKYMIDHFDLTLTYTHQGNKYNITASNKEREANQTIIYTSDFPKNTTQTNEWGIEVVVTLPEKPVMEFGTSVVGEVTAVRERGQKQTVAIPENGFVLSGHGTGAKGLENVKVGDSITLDIHIDQKWKDSAFMLASGPLLVKDGKVNLTMDPKSDNARIRAPRTAIAIDRSGTRVYFVTVDGRQSGYSTGMSLTEFANHLVSLGVDRALNLDGGGSTAMAVRYPGKSKISLVNRPSDGRERGVPSVLMAVSKVAPTPFSDLLETHWAYDAVKRLYDKGTITGFPDGTFKPDHQIKRSHVALMFAREFNLDTKNAPDPGFKDVKKTDPEYGAIAAVAHAGLFEGRGSGIFGKDDSLTRAEMATVIQRAYQIGSAKKPANFSDIKGHWAYDAINAIAEVNITQGYEDGTFRPDRHVTRAEFSQFLINSSHLK